MRHVFGLFWGAAPNLLKHKIKTLLEIKIIKKRGCKWGITHCYVLRPLRVNLIKTWFTMNNYKYDSLGGSEWYTLRRPIWNIQNTCILLLRG